MPSSGFLTLSISLIALLVGAAFSALAARRAAYERVMRVLDFVSEGAAARARHCVGALVFDYPEQLASGERIPFSTTGERSARIEDLFAILWAARRIEATRRSLGWEWAHRGPHELLKESVEKWVEWWVHVPPGTDGKMRIEQVGLCLDASLDRADDLDGLLTLRDKWR